MDGPYTDRLFALFTDGSVWELRWNLDEVLYRRLVERADGNVIPSDLDAPPAKPATEDEKKQAARLREGLVKGRERNRQAADERASLIEQLDKAGGAVPAAELPEDASIEELDRERQRLERQGQALWDDVLRLRAELEKRKKEKK
jgi:hypothetical protein